MRFDQIFGLINSYLQQGEPFAVAQVINRQAPSSGKIGDKAIILASGKIIGWIGGGCVRGIVIKEALTAIDQREHRLVRVGADTVSRDKEGFKIYKMTCHSQGIVDFLIEPMMPYPQLIIVGRSSIAQTLARVAGICGFPVEMMAQNTEDLAADLENESLLIKEGISFTHHDSLQKNFIVVATQGEDDENAIELALSTDAKYVGFVASKSKAARVKEYLKGLKKLPEKRIEELRAPVGLDIHAKGHSEVAISILAEIISHFREKNSLVPKDSSTNTPSAKKDSFLKEFYINPVCQVPVSKKNPKHIVEYRGEAIYFCCDGCKIKFEKNPEKYIKTE